jgi:hypothetical protein
MRRLIPFFVVAVILLGAIPAVLLVSSRSSHTHGQSPVAITSPAQMDPQERCVVAVMSLLGQTLQAVQNGYSSGLSPDEVAVRYGTDSDVFHVFSYAQATLIGNVYSQGADGQLTAIQPLVRQECQQWSTS